MSDIKLQNSIDLTLSNIENDINNISDVLNNIYQAVLTLDETKWNTKEKKKMEEEFLPYLKKISTKYPIYLNNRLTFTRNSINKYKELNKEQQLEAENLEDLSL